MDGDGSVALGAALRAAGAASGDVLECEPLTGGTYNTLHRVVLRDGARWIVKIPPPASLPGLSHERGLLGGEVEFYTAAGRIPGVPVPRVVRYETDPGAPTGAFLVMSACPGASWQEWEGRLAAGERAALRAELGGVVARLHTVTGHGFGYPARPFGPLAATWREAFTRMLARLLEDAVHYGVRLPRTPDAIGALASGAAGALDEVTVPVAVHFDLWQGNVLLDGAPGARTVSGIVDGERMFWGDPLADFVSLALLDDIERDGDFLAGYAAAGGTVRWDRAARVRMAFYRCYLYLIMLVEAVPRAYPRDHREWADRHVAPRLEAALVELSRADAA
ncbi:phosphotransferase family protein [Streptomyces corynorhini]|uniref:Aminoglycoside phosphotransferase family protein n=1 Tax=Streptomyces corynorhini TaxID=2282652 RepID=A0A370BDB1_9ACTN|nr:aminoglycoside phosphotransferase family protein [Streptomyces corynorhini]RDG38379.1 aminoglycoside phosphotransferase family protein [Streptomyces corynorhini]